jgi:tetratricopeptide (TPR) repeat protein/predicted Ser/Thr protein kinase
MTGDQDAQIEDRGARGGFGGAGAPTPEQLAAMPTLDEASGGGGAPVGRSVPGVIGRFRVIRELGAGGMGVVYEAEQAEPRRRVALKVMRSSLVSGAAMERFERESAVLGMLAHPGIAQVFDAGRGLIDDAGEPVSYFAMELVEGAPLTDWAASRGLSARERLGLLAEVARAVHHAHAKGVIHRDLKPGNVLVDGSGRVRVLDFGIARLTEDAGVGGATETGQLVGTLAYMSPEQASGVSGDLDTRSDVFALGVIGYELLSGRLPHAVEGRSIVESVRTIAEGEIKPLSSVDVRLRGDVATIIGKALEKDRERRYQSADELAEDIGRYLRDEPITARPPSLSYSLAKLARRHKPVVAGVVLGVCALTAGAGVASWQAVQATRAGEAARTEAAVSGEVSGFLERMLESADPTRAQGRELTVREVVASAAGEIEDAGLSPEVGARLRYTLGKTASMLGDYDRAVALLEESARLFAEIDGEAGRSAINARRQLGFTHAEAGRPAELEAIALETAATLEREFGRDDPDAIAARGEIARARLDQGDVAGALEGFRAALADAEAALGPTSDVRLSAMHNLASALGQAGELRESVELNERVLAIRLEALGERHPDTITTMNNIATTLVRLGETERAEAMLRDVLRLRREVLGDEHRATATAIQNLTGVLLPQGRLDEAEPLVREALAICRARLGAEHPVTLSAMNQLAYMLEDRGRLDEAEPLYRETISILERTAGRSNPEMLAPINNLASLLVRDGRAEQAEPLYRELLETTESVVGRGHYMGAIFRSNYGECLTAMGRRDDAISALEEAVSVLEGALGAEHARTAKARERLETARALPGG